MPNRGKAYVFYTALYSQADPTTFISNATLAAGDVLVSVDGAAEANITTLPVVTPAGAFKHIKVSLSTNEMTGDNIHVLFQDAAGAQWIARDFNIQTDLYATGVVDAGQLVSISATGVELRANHGVSALGSAMIEFSGTSTDGLGKSRIISYSGSGNTFTVDPPLNRAGESTPSGGTINYRILPAPPSVVSSYASVNVGWVSNLTVGASGTGGQGVGAV